MLKHMLQTKCFVFIHLVYQSVPYHLEKSIHLTEVFLPKIKIQNSNKVSTPVYCYIEKLMPRETRIFMSQMHKTYKYSLEVWSDCYNILL